MSLWSRTKFEPSSTIIAFGLSASCTFELRRVKLVVPAWAWKGWVICAPPASMSSLSTETWLLQSAWNSRVLIGPTSVNQLVVVVLLAPLLQLCHSPRLNEPALTLCPEADWTVQALVRPFEPRIIRSP